MRRRIALLATGALLAVGFGAAGTAVPASADQAPRRAPEQATEQVAEQAPAEHASGTSVAAGAVDPITAAVGTAVRNASLAGQLAELNQDGPTADELRQHVETCGTQISNGKYPERVGQEATVPICQKGTAIFWRSGMTIDCDGQRTSECNSNTDQYYQPQTSCQESDGEYLIASELPFIVVPQRSSIWDPRASGIDCGTVGAVLYEDRVVYAVMGDRGPTGQVGEGSYALADGLGIDPDPSTGGVSGRVVDYITFPDVTADPIEDHGVATDLGTQAANAFVNRDPSCDDVTRDHTAYDTLESGAEGDLVSTAQCLLQARGLDPGEIDGTFGESTAAAVSDFQTEVGLDADGVLDSHTWTALLSAGSTPLLRNGDTGAAVTRVQRSLTAALGRTVDIDGIFGSGTEQAVRDYQSAVGLGVDGIVGPNTWDALQSGR